MSNYLIISKENAELIQGKYGKPRGQDNTYPAELRPVPLPDGMFVLPERCLSDPELLNVDKILSKMAISVKEIKQIDMVKDIVKDEYYVVNYIEEEKTEIVKCVSTLDISKMDVKTIDYNTDRHFLTFNDETGIVGKALNFFGL